MTLGESEAHKACVPSWQVLSVARPCGSEVGGDAGGRNCCLRRRWKRRSSEGRQFLHDEAAIWGAGQAVRDGAELACGSLWPPPAASSSQSAQLSVSCPLFSHFWILWRCFRCFECVMVASDCYLTWTARFWIFPGLFTACFVHDNVSSAFGVVTLYLSEWWFSCGASGEPATWSKLNTLVASHVESMHIYPVHTSSEGNEDLGILQSWLEGIWKSPGIIHVVIRYNRRLRASQLSCRISYMNFHSPVCSWYASCWVETLQLKQTIFSNPAVSTQVFVTLSEPYLAFLFTVIHLFSNTTQVVP